MSGIPKLKWSTNWDNKIPFLEPMKMAGKPEEAECFVLKLQQVEAPKGQGKSVQEAVR